MPSATARKNWARRFRSRARCSPSARTTARQDAGAHVAGLALGQDLSERLVRWRGPTPLRPGDRLVTHADVIGEMTTTFTAA